MAIANVLIGNTDTTLLTVPVGKRYAIVNIFVCNNEDYNAVHEEHGATVFDLHLVKSGDPISNDNIVVNNLQMPASETFVFDSEKIVLEPGDRIIVVGESPTVLSATVSYWEV